MSRPWTSYVAEHLEPDARRLLPDAYRPRVGPRVRPVEPMLARLPPASAGALAAWDRLARAGAIPDMFAFEQGGLYGFDFVGQGVTVLDGDSDISAQLWTLGHEGGGDGYVVLPTGAVGQWDHELGVLVPGRRFPDLDVFGWAVVLVGAADAGVLATDEVLAALTDEGSTGCAALAARVRDSLDD